MNLAVNARDAMQAGGSLTISVGEAAVDGHASGLPPGLTAGRYVTIAVRDSGTGMTSSTRDHMFEPFFTTKPRDKGTGLGLATAYGIVKQSGGAIAVESVLGSGATFTVYLPRLASNATLAATHAPIEVRRLATQTVLLVEDEPAVRRLTRRILEDRGYRVIEAADGPQALDAARLHAGPIDLLLTDVVMPLMSGHELAAQIIAVRAETAVVYMSGFADDPLTRRPDSGVIRFVQKPFTADALMSKLREATPPLQ
jgi:CheY-like chemotaxis protein